MPIHAHGKCRCKVDTARRITKSLSLWAVVKPEIQAKVIAIAVGAGSSNTLEGAKPLTNKVLCRNERTNLVSATGQ